MHNEQSSTNHMRIRVHEKYVQHTAQIHFGGYDSLLIIWTDAFVNNQSAYLTTGHLFFSTLSFSVHCCISIDFVA